ncbi:hypothetical protein RB195_001036 [Necator americanus]|uniref:Reverse transcriptase domain-containing protein n=1 Tax=Necator americanus TaxID=51031 RepID=A0ABR1DCF2_NECAM
MEKSLLIPEGTLGKRGLQESRRLPKEKIFTYNARTLASDAAIGDGVRVRVNMNMAINMRRKAAKFTKQTPRTTIHWELFASTFGFWENTVVDNIDDEHEQAYTSEWSSKSRREPRTHVRGREALQRDDKRRAQRRRRTQVLAEAAEAGKSIRYARRDFAIRLTAYTISHLIEISREYKVPLRLTSIDLKKAFDTVETEAAMEALENQGVPTPYIKKGLRQTDTISPKIFGATLENAMQGLEWNNMGVESDGTHKWLLHHLQFADDIIFTASSISQAELMLPEFDETCKKIGLQLDLDKKMLLRKGWVSDAPFTLNGTNISECFSYVYLGRETKMMNYLTSELSRWKRAA